MAEKDIYISKIHGAKIRDEELTQRVSAVENNQTEYYLHNIVIADVDGEWSNYTGTKNKLWLNLQIINDDKTLFDYDSLAEYMWNATINYGPILRALPVNGYYRESADSSLSIIQNVFLCDMTGTSFEDMYLLGVDVKTGAFCEVDWQGDVKVFDTIISLSGEPNKYAYLYIKK